MARRDNAWRRKYREWTEYRSGEKPSAKAVTVAPIWKADKRKTMIDVAMEVMRDWRMTPFEHEGDSIAGLRSSLCLEGYSWPRSNAAAVDVVSAALKHLGAQRPTWEQGQPDYVEARDICLQCKGALEIGRSGTGYKYCSTECARIAMQKRDFEVRSTADKTFSAAKLMIERSKMKPIVCERVECGKVFHPLPHRGKRGPQRFCSNYCSLHSRLPRPESEFNCVFCGEVFLSRSSKTPMYCSRVCQQCSFLESRGHEFAVLRPHVFDHMFTVPVNDSRMTPQKLDWLFLEAGCTITAQAA